MTTSIAASENIVINRRPVVPAVERFWVNIPAVIALVGLFIMGVARAADIPPLAEIEPAIAAAHPELIKQRAALVKQRKSMRDATQRHNKVCSNVEPGSAADTRCSKALAILSTQVNDHIQASKTYNDKHRAVVLKAAPNTDPSVVDARVPRDGAYLVDQVPELKKSPAADRIAKGFQAVINHQWPVALAWWQEALQRDPGNAALKRSVDLAQWMVDRRNAVAAGPVTPLGAAFYSASHGEISKAIRQFELAKTDNPAIAPQAEQMIAALRQRQAKDAAIAAYWDREITKGMRQLVDGLREVGMNHLSVGDEDGAQEAFREADFFSMGLPVDN